MIIAKTKFVWINNNNADVAIIVCTCMRSTGIKGNLCLNCHFYIPRNNDVIEEHEYLPIINGLKRY